MVVVVAMELVVMVMVVMVVVVVVVVVLVVAAAAVVAAADCTVLFAHALAPHCQSRNATCQLRCTHYKTMHAIDNR